MACSAACDWDTLPRSRLKLWARVAGAAGCCRLCDQAPGVDGIHGDLRLGEQLHRFAKLVRVGIVNTKRVRQRGVGNDVEGERSGEPDQVFAARKRSKVVCQSVEGVERVGHAEVSFGYIELLLKRPQIGCQEDGRRASGNRRRCDQRGVGGEIWDALLLGGGMLSNGRRSGNQFALDHVAKHRRIGGEALQKDEVVRQSEDRDACVWIGLANVLEQLGAHEALTLQGRIQPVDEQDVERFAGRDGRIVREVAGRKRREGGCFRR